MTAGVRFSWRPHISRTLTNIVPNTGLYRSLCRRDCLPRGPDLHPPIHYVALPFSQSPRENRDDAEERVREGHGPRQILRESGPLCSTITEDNPTAAHHSRSCGCLHAALRYRADTTDWQVRPCFDSDCSRGALGMALLCLTLQNTANLLIQPYPRSLGRYVFCRTPYCGLPQPSFTHIRIRVLFER